MLWSVWFRWPLSIMDKMELMPFFPKRKILSNFFYELVHSLLTVDKIKLISGQNEALNTTLCQTGKSDCELVHLWTCLIIIIIYPLTARVVGAPQMTSQPVSSIFPCSLLPSGNWRISGLSIPWCCLPASYSFCLVFFPLSLCLARWCWPERETWPYHCSFRLTMW